MNKFIVLVALALVSPMALCETNIYMHPTGNDASTNPRTPKNPLRTLAGVQDFLSKNNIQGDINVCIAPEVYSDQTVLWLYYPEDGNITFQPTYLCPTVIVLPTRSGSYTVANIVPRESNHVVRPIFDGSGVRATDENTCKTTGIWFEARYTRKLRFRQLHVRHYQAAMLLRGDPRLYGDRDNPDARPYYGGNIVEGSLFEKIGASWVTGYGSSETAISLMGTTDNIIRNNEFHRIEAPAEPADCGDYHTGDQDFHMHALYVSYASRNNQIIGNDFAYISGSTIRFRDGSDNNVVKDNTIAWGGPSHDDNHTYAMVQEWAEPSKGEWISCGTEIRSNRRGPGYTESVNEYMAVFHGDEQAAPGRNTCPDSNPHFIPSDVTELRAVNPPLTGCELKDWYASMELVDDSVACSTDTDSDSDSDSEPACGPGTPYECP